MRRRGFIGGVVATAALAGAGRGRAQDRFDQEALLAVEPYGTLTLVHWADLNAQAVPIHHREPALALGPDGARETGEAFRIRYGVGGATPMDYALTHENFAELAEAYGPMGGLDRIATVVAAIRADRPGALVFDGGNGLTGSLVSAATEARDMVEALAALRPDAMGLDRALRLGPGRLGAVTEGLGCPLLAQNVVGSGGKVPEGIASHAVFERGGVRVAVIGQAYPHQAGASAGVRVGVQEAGLRETVARLRAQGAALVVVLSQMGLAADAKLAASVDDIDVILSGNAQIALPEPLEIGATRIIASGSHGKFVSRIDIAMEGGAMAGLRQRLIPVFADLIAPEPGMTARIARLRAPFAAQLSETFGEAGALLYRRDTFRSPWDDVICTALMHAKDAQVALVPGLGRGQTILPGQSITGAALASLTAAEPPGIETTEMTGAALKDLLELAADAVFNPDPYQRQGTEMLRAGGLGMGVRVSAPFGARIQELSLVESGAPIEADRRYRVARWAGSGTGGETVAAALARHIEAMKVVQDAPVSRVVWSG